MHVAGSSDKVFYQWLASRLLCLGRTFKRWHDEEDQFAMQFNLLPMKEQIQLQMVQAMMPDRRVPSQGMPEQGAPEQGVAEQSMPEEGVAEQSVPEQGMPRQNALAPALRTPAARGMKRPASFEVHLCTIT